MTTTEPTPLPSAAPPAARTAYFRAADDGTYLPNDVAAGVWAPNSISGRILGGLVAHVVEREQARPGYRLARLTCDMFRTLPFAPVSLTTRAVREGGRIRVADVLLEHDGSLFGRATAVFLRPGSNPPGEIWQPDRGVWQAPDPASPNPNPNPINPRIDGRPMLPGVVPPDTPLGPHRIVQRGGMWVRELSLIVEDRPMTGVVRAAMLADMTSPMTHQGTGGIQHINTDWTLTLVREPVGEFLGVLAEDQFGADGISFGRATIHDAAGLLGSCTITALANPGRADPNRFPRNS
ncbi:thioesterase family protein [Frankia sp. AgB1.9]|uniref:acyl-CoA thioesterase domain-containing protein n=1 Tax=unclassified Frankia TaxID=2632575 RepID=UPI0019332AA5|nr:MULTISPECIES: acyl-CoA thioesterase domain-containing protein [unclassified Frankia]MBL7486645.1 thioesterase family protein [Frankia sp. AgW1.1]MBL7549196.1 thioesterase family protein [Frankia sp. AgB1.9]MBL7622360.1 thioesterase family protein [Frankia sp. AgB1.8]